MPAGIGYPALGLPPGFLDQPQAGGLMQPPPTLDEQMAGAPPAIGLPPGMLAQVAPNPLPAPVPQSETAGPLQLPPGMQAAPEPAAMPVPQSVAQPAPMPMAAQALAEPMVDDVLAGIDPNDAIAMATRAAEVSRDVQRANLAEAQRLNVAVKEEADKQERRLAERAEREERARERVAAQNAEVQAALRAGPEGTWRDVARTGTEALFAVLGAAFDRSGLLQQALPQTLNGIIQQGQERVQSAFARQLQALQVGREQAGDELDAAMDDERRIEAAGASARTALIEESMRQMDLAVQQGKVDLATLEAAGIPAQMTAQLTEAQAKQRALQLEEQRKADKEALAARKTEEEIAASRANRAKQWAALDLDRQRLALDKERSQTLKQQDLLENEKKKLDILREQGIISDKEMARTVPLPGGGHLKANSAEQARPFADQLASAEILGGLMDQIAVALETGDRDYWGGKEGQELLAKWGAAKLATKDAEQLGAIQGADEALIENLIGKDPTSISVGNLRTQAPRIREARRILEEKVNARARSISTDWAGSKQRVELPRYEAPETATASADEVQSRLALKPGKATGSVPKLDAKEVTSYVQQLRADIDRQQSAGKLTDRVTGQPVDKEGVVIEQAYRLVDTVKANRGTAAEMAREVDRLKGTKGLPAGQIKRMGELVQAQRNLEATNARIAVELERERRFLSDRAKRSDATVADKAALEAVESVIGQYGKQSKGRDVLKARGEDR